MLLFLERGCFWVSSGGFAEGRGKEAGKLI